MTAGAELSAFAEKLRNGMREFRRVEALLRSQYAALEGGVAESMPLEMLERPTRRFLIDHFLRALDWDPDDATQIIEEARARSANKDRLYFDYLGVSPIARAPVLIVEAKGFDVSGPRRARGSDLDATGMKQLICEAILELKDGSRRRSGITAEWTEYLTDLQNYVSALDDFGKSTLRRVVISAGSWIVVFEEPVDFFAGAGKSDSEKVHCFPDGDAILLRHVELFEMLHRRRLVDSLPLVLEVADALEFLPPDKIGECYRAVFVATSSTTGAERRKYPTRSVYPAMLVSSGNRWFAIVNFDSSIEEPKGKERIAEFLKDLGQAGDDLEARLRARFGIPLLPLALNQFPGFPEEVSRQRSSIGEVLPLPGSTAARFTTNRGLTFVVPSGEPGANAEFVVVTGQSWFYKSDLPNTPRLCGFHYWKHARNIGVNDGDAVHVCSASSFTADGQDRHCAHGDLRRVRTQRCHVLALDSHMCCHTCVFFSVCWTTDSVRLPCPTM